MMKVLDLFSGIGGFSLGLERTGGFRTVAFCEIEPYCRKVLAKHWPDVRCYPDVRTLSAVTLRSDGIAVDVICGGFPCQDISSAGKGAGIDGERSGLWSEFARLIGELRPRYVIVENVAALLGRGLGRVLGDLASLRYDAEWHCIPAAAVGAPHRRDRVWIMANADLDARQQWRDGDISQGSGRRHADRGSFGQDVADAERAERRPLGKACDRLAWADSLSQWQEGAGGAGSGGWWQFEPELGRVAHGVPHRVDRLKGLGNAVVPQIPELIGRAILAREGTP